MTKIIDQYFIEVTSTLSKQSYCIFGSGFFLQIYSLISSDPYDIILSWLYVCNNRYLVFVSDKKKKKWILEPRHLCRCVVKKDWLDLSNKTHHRINTNYHSISNSKGTRGYQVPTPRDIRDWRGIILIPFI